MEALSEDELEEMAWRFIRRGDQEAWLSRLSQLRSRELWEQFARETFLFEGAGEPSQGQIDAITAGGEILLDRLGQARIVPEVITVRGRQQFAWRDPVTGRFAAASAARGVLQTINSRLRGRRGR